MLISNTPLRFRVQYGNFELFKLLTDVRMVSIIKLIIQIFSISATAVTSNEFQKLRPPNLCPHPPNLRFKDSPTFGSRGWLRQKEFADSNKKKLPRRLKEGKNLRTRIGFTNTKRINIKLKISEYEQRLTQERNIFYSH